MPGDGIGHTGRLAVSALAILGFLGFAWIMLTVDIPTNNRDVVLTIGGILGGAFSGVMSYWLGSSAGSARKDQVIQQQQAAAAPPPPVPPPPEKKP